MDIQAREADPRPVYVQIAEDLKSLTLSGELATENRTPSTKELSGFYQVNPIMAAKATTELSMVGLVGKKRGLGMFVTPGTRERVQAKRREMFQRTYIKPLKAEAGVLGLMLGDIITMLEGGK